MTQVLGFTIQNNGGSSATIINPHAQAEPIGATVTSKQYTMKGLYKLRGLPSTGGTTEVDVLTINLDTNGSLTVTPVPAASPASEFYVHTLCN